MWESNWWKSPVLQGPENDYGQYDYMIEEIPHDYAKWEYQEGKDRCHSCGKESHLLFYSYHYFHTLDGYDYFDYTECWKCMVKDKIHSIKRKVELKVKTFKIALDLYSNGKRDFKHYYELAKKIVR